MKRSHWMTTAAALLVLAAPAWAAPAPGEKSPLAWAPATAPVVFHANSPEALRDHVVAFVKNALPDRADMVQQAMDNYLKNGFQDRKLRGLAKDGPIFLVFTELPQNLGPDKPPKFAIVAAVTSYAEFRDNILTADEKKSLKKEEGYESVSVEGTTAFLVDKKDYAVLTPDKDVAAMYAKGISAGLDGKMSKVQAAKLLASDVGLYVDLDAVNKQFGDHIKAAEKELLDQMDKIGENVPKAQKAQFETTKKMIEPLFQCVQDSKNALITAEIRPGGVSLHVQDEVRAGTQTADLLKGSKLSAFPDLGKLPAGDVFYMGMELDPAFVKFTSSMIAGMSTDPNSKGAKAMTEAYDNWAKAGPSEAMSAVTYPVAGLSVTKFSDPEKGAAAATKMLEAMGGEGAMPTVAFKDKPEIKPNAQKYNNISFTSMHAVWDLDKMMSASNAQLPDNVKKDMVEGMKKLMGEEMNAWIGTDGKAVYQATAKDWPSAQKILDQYFKGQGTVGADKAFAAARKELPEQASFVFLLDAVQGVGDVIDFVKPILESSGAPVPGKFPQPVKGKPGYVGFAASMEPDRGGFELVITSEAVKQVYEGYVSPLLPKD
jgi:hypothetical protein